METPPAGQDDPHVLHDIPPLTGAGLASNLETGWGLTPGGRPSLTFSRRAPFAVDQHQTPAGRHAPSISQLPYASQGARHQFVFGNRLQHCTNFSEISYEKNDVRYDLTEIRQLSICEVARHPSYGVARPLWRSVCLGGGFSYNRAQNMTTHPKTIPAGGE